MTIQLNRLPSLPTILEYSGDDNIKTARLGERDRTNTASIACVTIGPNKENVTYKQQQQQQVISSPRRDDTIFIDKESSAQSNVVTYTTTSTSCFQRLFTTLLSRASNRPRVLNHNTTDTHFRRTSKNRPTVLDNCSNFANCETRQINTIEALSSSFNMERKLYDKQKYDTKKFLLDAASLLRSLCKRLLIISIMISFLFMGLSCNLAQFVLYVTIYPVNKRLFQNINYYLIYTIMSPVISLAYYWANIKLNIRVAKSELLKQAKDPMLGFIVINHTYEMDWLVCAVFGDQLDNLGAYKVVSKSELKYLPIIGWMSIMSQMLFVDRNWTKDKQILGKGLNKLLDYKQTMLGLFCEGTRLTPEKFEASVNYAKANNLKPLKYHLLPRPKGFAYCVRHLMKIKCNKDNENSEKAEIVSRYSDKEVPFRIFNAQVMIPARPTFGWLMRGETFQADFFIEEVERSQYENLTEPAEFEQLLYDIYQRKDELVDIYKSNNNNFSDGFKFEFRRKVAPLITSITGYLLTYSVLFKFALAYSSSIIFWLSLATIIVSSLTLFSKIDKESRSKYSSRLLYDSKRPRSGRKSSNDLFNDDTGPMHLMQSANGLTTSKISNFGVSLKSNRVVAATH